MNAVDRFASVCHVKMSAFALMWALGPKRRRINDENAHTHTRTHMQTRMKLKQRNRKLDYVHEQMFTSARIDNFEVTQNQAMVNEAEPSQVHPIHCLCI